MTSAAGLTHYTQCANDAKLFASCAMMRRADRGEGRITHGDDTRDGESLTRGPRAGHDKRPKKCGCPNRGPVGAPSFSRLALFSADRRKEKNLP